MEPPGTVRVKVCCISSVGEGRLAVSLGAAALGLVSAMPSGPGVIPEPLIAEIAATVPPAVDSVLLTSRRSMTEVVAQQRRTRVTAIQLVDRLAEGILAELRVALPGVTLIQVVHVTGEEALAEALELASEADALLLDSGNPNLAVKELGGTGRRHDWAISRRIREAVPIPVWLAGGLTPGNVAEAIATVGPYGVDVCTGVRRDGHLDEPTLAAFFAAVRGAAR